MGKPKALFLTRGGHTRNLPNTREVLEDILGSKAGLDVTTDDEFAELTPERIKAYDLVVNYAGYKADLEPSDAQLETLLGAVEAGMPYIPIHVANLMFKNQLDYMTLFGGWPDNPEPNDILNETQLRYLEMTGSTFVGHGPIETFTVKVVEDHPITAGITEFEATDELYVLGGDRSRLKVLAYARDQPSSYVAQWGKGKVYYNALGHGQQALSNPSFQHLLVQGVAWALDSR